MSKWGCCVLGFGGSLFGHCQTLLEDCPGIEPMLCHTPNKFWRKWSSSGVFVEQTSDIGTRTTMITRCYFKYWTTTIPMVSMWLCGYVVSANVCLCALVWTCVCEILLVLQWEGCLSRKSNRFLARTNSPQGLNPWCTPLSFVSCWNWF